MKFAGLPISVVFHFEIGSNAQSVGDRFEKCLPKIYHFVEESLDYILNIKTSTFIRMQSQNCGGLLWSLWRRIPTGSEQVLPGVSVFPQAGGRSPCPLESDKHPMSLVRISLSLSSSFFGILCLTSSSSCP